ncbi:unnamed protein product [Debaryomyces tyrocola]|nr:unnamed protein product [Debaryomyces tyrocola]
MSSFLWFNHSSIAIIHSYVTSSSRYRLFSLCCSFYHFEVYFTLWRLFSVHVFIFILLDSNVLVSLPFRMYPSQIVQQSFIYSTELISHTILY